MSSNRFYEILENAPLRFRPIANLFTWGENYTFKDSPVRVFLSMIGYMEEQYGESDLEAVPTLGYLELDLIGGALVSYANFGEEAHEWVTFLMDADLEPEDAHLQEEEAI